MKVKKNLQNVTRADVESAGETPHRMNLRKETKNENGKRKI